jgi:hypothetical protein
LHATATTMNISFFARASAGGQGQVSLALHWFGAAGRAGNPIATMAR